MVVVYKLQTFVKSTYNRIFLIFNLDLRKLLINKFGTENLRADLSGPFTCHNCNHIVSST
jgi:hypothetical protein